MAQIPLIVMMILTLLVLFISMVLSAKSASEINKNDLQRAHKSATYSAVICGVAVLLTAVALGYYLYTSRHELKSRF